MEEHLELVRKRFEQDRYARLHGIVLDLLTEDTIRMHMQLREDMLNWLDRPHGGAIYVLADAAFSVLGNNSNNLAYALDCSITYHAGPDPGALLVVEGEALAATARTASFLFKVYMEKEGSRTLIATMKSVSYRTGKPINPGIVQ
ncbi:MAG: hotdog fold thioesterase [Deltaproteobacteria bacterium]|nr:hotdog fold thioesterase [Deltaproteobacteria bacterium]